MVRKRKLTAEEALYYQVTGIDPGLSDGDEVRRVKGMTPAQTVEAVDLPSKFYDDAGNPNYKLPTFADAFPDAFARLTDGRPDAKIAWPRSGNDAGLATILLALLQSDDSEEDLADLLDLSPIPFDLTVRIFFQILNEQLTSNALWQAYDFLLVKAKVQDAIDAREDSRRGRIVSFPSGRPATDLSRRIKKIRETIKCSRPRAYIIEQDGTARLDQRIALAQTFKDDPDRCRPVNWEARSRARTWGRVSEWSFRRYIESGADLFEFDGEVGHALAALQDRYWDGQLPEDFRDLRTLIAAIEDAGAAVDRATIVTIFDAFKTWKRRHA